jgi:hypothetical protein
MRMQRKVTHKQVIGVRQRGLVRSRGTNATFYRYSLATLCLHLVYMVVAYLWRGWLAWASLGREVQVCKYLRRKRADSRRPLLKSWACSFISRRAGIGL